MGKGRKYKVSERVEAEIDEMAEWYKGSGVKHSAILSYSTRFREFAAWFSKERGREVQVDDVNDQLLKGYEGYLRSTYPTWTQILARLSPVKRYNRWAVETGKLPETKLIRKQFESKVKPKPKKEKKREISFEGEDAFYQWMVKRGRKLSTTQQQIYVLRSIGRWSISKGQGILIPQNATPELMDSYWEEKERSKNQLQLGRAAIHNYILWAIDEEIIAEDPFEEFLKWNRRERAGGWGLIDSTERRQFLEWVKVESDVDDDQVYYRMQSVSHFFRWYYLVKGKEISHKETSRELLDLYERYLRQTRIPPSERRLLSGATINGYLYSARWFVRWAECISSGHG